MGDRHVVIVGGGLSGLATGCYLRASGFRTTIIEHNLALGGVCTAWTRGPYTIDGCVQWLAGGPYAPIYEELGIFPAVTARTLSHLLTYRAPSAGINVSVTRDLDALVGALARVSAVDAPAMRDLVEAARHLANLTARSSAPATRAVGSTLRAAWEADGPSGLLAPYRATVARWAEASLQSPALRRLFSSIVPPGSSALVLLFLLGYLERGWITRPVGGTARFRNALVDTYERLGGDVRVHATVDEILVEGDRACGVRLADGTLVRADAVVSTSSTPETSLRLLGGRWAPAAHPSVPMTLFEPIVLASFGVAASFASSPPLLIVDAVTPFKIGDRENDCLRIRVCNDDDAFAPAGHTVVQVIVKTDYEWWATRGSRYTTSKDAVAAVLLSQLAPIFPGIREAVRVHDIATPLTFWSMARSWRGAYEGIAPSEASMFRDVEKTVAGLGDFYLAGQWVEPGSGAPTALASGRQAAERLCRDARTPFVTPR